MVDYFVFCHIGILDYPGYALSSNEREGGATLLLDIEKWRGGRKKRKSGYTN